MVSKLKLILSGKIKNNLLPLPIENIEKCSNKLLGICNSNVKKKYLDI